MIRTTPLQPPVDAAAPAQRRPVIAVLTGSTGRDDTVARLAAGQAASEEAQLVLAVPVPARPFGPTSADLTGRLQSPHAVSLAARVVRGLGRPAPPLALITVPFTDREGSADRDSRIASALVDVSRRLSARQLLVAGSAVGELGAPRLPDELSAAADEGQLPLTHLTVIPHTRTSTRPHSAVTEGRDRASAGGGAVPSARLPADLALGTEPEPYAHAGTAVTA